MAATGSFSRRERAQGWAFAPTETETRAPGEAQRSETSGTSASARRRIGSLFAGRFRLTGLLGMGGMGVVYAAEDEHRRRRVAIKFVKSGARSRSSRGARLKREGRVVTRLEHPSLVRTLGSGEFDGEPYVVLEFVPGARSLSDLQPELERSEMIRIVRDAALALGHAHALGVVHRDVKPENILVDDRGQVRVVDFGLATMRDSDRITKEGDCLGTPLFMAPESILHAETTPQVDVWGLGVTLYWLLTDRFPFEADSLEQLLPRILSGQPASPRRLDPAIPPRVERACLRALARDPHKRHPNGAALAHDLDRWLLGEFARQAGTRRQPRAGPRRRDAAWSGLWLVPLAVGATLAAAVALAELGVL